MMSVSVPSPLNPIKYLLSVLLKADLRPVLCSKTDSETNEVRCRLVFGRWILAGEIGICYFSGSADFYQISFFSFNYLRSLKSPSVRLLQYPQLVTHYCLQRVFPI